MCPTARRSIMTDKKASTEEEAQALELRTMEKATTLPQHSDINGDPTEQRVRLITPTPTHAKVPSTVTVVTLWGGAWMNSRGQHLGDGSSAGRVGQGGAVVWKQRGE